MSGRYGWEPEALLDRFPVGSFAAVRSVAHDQPTDPGTCLKVREVHPDLGVVVASTSRGPRQRYDAAALVPVGPEYARASGWRGFDPAVWTRKERAAQSAVLVVLALLCAGVLVAAALGLVAAGRAVL